MKKYLVLVIVLVAVFAGLLGCAHLGQPELTASEQDILQIAVEHYTAEIEQWSRTYIYYFKRGECYRKLGEYENAIEDYSEILYNDPMILTPEQLRTMAKLFDKMGHDREAKEAYEAVKSRKFNDRHGIDPYGHHDGIVLDPGCGCRSAAEPMRSPSIQIELEFNSPWKKVPAPKK